MNISIHRTVKRPWGPETSVTVSEGELIYSIIIADTEEAAIIQKATKWFQSKLAELQAEKELKQFVRIPRPLDIVWAADNYLQQVLDNLTDMHNTLKALNLYGSTDNDTEASINSGQDQKAQAVKNALIAYRNGWTGQFDTEQSDAMADPARWKNALKNFVVSNLGNLDWFKKAVE